MFGTQGGGGFSASQTESWWAWAALIIAGLLAIILLLGAVFGVGLWDAILLDGKEFDPLIEVDVAGDTINVAPADVIVNISCPIETCLQWVYAVPFVCGLTEFVVNETTRVAIAEHSFSMTVFNPKELNITFDKRVSLTFPPGNQFPGDVFLSTPADNLTSYEALEMACAEIRNLIEPEPYKRELGSLIKGYVSVFTQEELIVWGIHGTSSNSDGGGGMGGGMGGGWGHDGGGGDGSRYDGGEDGGDGYGDGYDGGEDEDDGPLFTPDAITFDKERALGICVEKTLCE